MRASKEKVFLMSIGGCGCIVALIGLGFAAILFAIAVKTIM